MKRTFRAPTTRMIPARMVSVVAAGLLVLSGCCAEDDASATTAAGAVVPGQPGGQTTAPAGTDTTQPADVLPTETYPDLTGTLVGSGSSAQKSAMGAWQAGFQQIAPQSTVEYDPIGSGGGREAFLAGGTLFAGSDAPLSDDEIEKSKSRCDGDQGAIDLPHYISPIAVTYNLPTLAGTELRLTPDVIAGIFANQISNWSDPAIAATNPDVELPDLAINPVHRSDESGTTKNFTDYLAKAAPGVWTWGAIQGWDTEGPGGGEGAAQTAGVIAAVRLGEGSVGYADASQLADLPAAAVGVNGEFVTLSAQAAARIIDSSTRIPGRNPNDYAIEVNRTPTTADTYPIALISYHIVCLQYANPNDAELVRAFMTYVGSSAGQSAAAAAAGSAPISPAVSAELLTSVNAIRAGA